MIIRLFNGKNLVVQIGIIVVLLATLFNQEITLLEPKEFGPLYNLLYYLIAGNKYLIYAIYLLIILAQGAFLQLIVLRFNLVPRNNILTPFIWLLLIISIPSAHVINPIFISSLLCSWAIYRLFIISEIENPLPDIFSVGFLLSLASLVYGNILWLYPFVLISLLLLRLFQARKVVVISIGFVLPYLYLLAYNYIFDNNYFNWNYFQFNWKNWNIFPYEEFQWASIIILVTIFIVSFISISSLMMNLFSKKIQIRNLTSVLFAMLIFSLFLQFTAANWWLVHPLLTFTPLSILLSIFLSEQKRTLYFDLVFGLILGLEVFLIVVKYAETLS